MHYKSMITNLIYELIGVGGQLSIAHNQAGAQDQEEGVESRHSFQ